MKKSNYDRVTRFREAWVWLKEEEKLYAQFLKGYHPVIHLFCGKSSLGDVRVDCEDFPNVTHRLEIRLKGRTYVFLATPSGIGVFEAVKLSLKS